MRTATTTPLLLALALTLSLSAAGCDRSPVPPDGTAVTSTSEVFRRTAADLQEECSRMGGCTCILDGIQTTCGIVFACLDAGFCRLVAA